MASIFLCPREPQLLKDAGWDNRGRSRESPRRRCPVPELGVPGMTRVGAGSYTIHTFWVFVVVEVALVLRAAVGLQGRPEPE